MKRLFPQRLFPLLLALLLPSCGGGGDGDKMTDYWVSAARFANQTKSFRLISGMGSVVIQAHKSLNIGPEDPADVEAEAVTTNKITGKMITEGMPDTGIYFAENLIYTTDKESKKARITIEMLTQSIDTPSESHAMSLLIMLLGSPGGWWSPPAYLGEYTIENDWYIELDFNTGTWMAHGTVTDDATLIGPLGQGGEGRFTVIPAY